MCQFQFTMLNTIEWFSIFVYCKCKCRKQTNRKQINRCVKCNTCLLLMVESIMHSILLHIYMLLYQEYQELANCKQQINFQVWNRNRKREREKEKFCFLLLFSFKGFEPKWYDELRSGQESVMCKKMKIVKLKQ